MNKREYERMKNELKKEFLDILKSKKLNGIIDILEKYHPQGKPARIRAQVLVLTELIESDKNRGKFDPICTFSVSEDSEGNYSRVAFGIIPEGVLLAKRVKHKGGRA